MNKKESFITDTELIAVQAQEIETYKALLKQQSVDRVALDNLRRQTQGAIIALIEIHGAVSDLLHSTDVYAIDHV